MFNCDKRCCGGLLSGFGICWKKVNSGRWRSVFCFKVALFWRWRNRFWT